MDERTQDTGQNEEGVRNAGRDLVGPGTAGSATSATSAASATELVRPEPVDDPEVAALVEDLRRDESVLEDDVAAASEQIGTGTDR